MKDCKSLRGPSYKFRVGYRERRLKLICLFGLCFLWVSVVVSRLFGLQISGFEKWQEWATKQHVAEVKLASERGPILDRSNRFLAVSVPVGSVFVRPKLVRDKDLTIKRIAAILSLPEENVRQKFHTNAPFVWIQRLIPRARAETLDAEKLRGVGYVVEARRYYPYSEAGSAVIGKLGIDGNGLSGLEKSYDSYLHRPDITTIAGRDAFGKIIQGKGDVLLETPRGEALKLTIDADLQIILDEELRRGRDEVGAKSAMGMLIDSDTGEILAMGQSPGLDPNADKVPSPLALRSLLAETVYEPGSTMKPMIAAAALEEGVVSPGDAINCEHGRYVFGKKLIKDVHPIDTVTFQDVLVRSSNIGMTKVGARLGRNRLYKYLRQFGFGDSTKIGLPGETSGILRKAESWAEVDIATHSFGQGIAVTPLQMVRAFSTLVNGGKLMPLRLIDDGSSVEYRRVISDETAERIRAMLFGVVEDEHGTGRMAAIPGVRVGGKTGTAQKPDPHGRGYLIGKYIASFLGFVDAAQLGIRERMTLIIVVDEPSNGPIYGGVVAAPIFKSTMQRTLQFLITKRELNSVPSRVINNLPKLQPASYIVK